jgi:para-nitrobenzyl esterase
MCGTCRDETVFFGLFGSPDTFRIDEAGPRTRLSSTYQGAELDQIIRTAHGRLGGRGGRRLQDARAG